MGLILAAGLRAQTTPEAAQPALPEAPQPAPADPVRPPPGDARMSPYGGYERPTGPETLHAIVADSVGPYPVIMALGVAGFHQMTNNPPDWGQGWGPFAERFGSNMGVTLTSNAARYGLAAALNMNTLYYRCSCTDVKARIRHAVLSTFIARRRTTGAEVFSLPGVVAPYAGTFMAVYGWYPRRYGAEDAFRMGNYGLLGRVATNMVFEFLPRKLDAYLREHNLISTRTTQEKTSKP